MESQKHSSNLVSEATVPASTLTPQATTPRPQDTAEIRICIPPAATADDDAFVTAITDVVNTVYHETESDIFVPGYKRTANAEVADFLRTGQLAVAYLESNTPAGQEPTGDAENKAKILPAQVVGCVCIKRLSPTLGEFGMLALDPAYRGGGLGARMAQFAEAHSRHGGCTTMQLEILIPQTFHHAFKDRLLKWYVRMGYELVKIGDFMQDYPHLAPLLAGPTEYRVFEKLLNHE